MTRPAAISRIIALVACTFAASDASGQSVVFLETVDASPASSTRSLANTTWDNPHLEFTGTVDTRTTSSSAGYPQASGHRNVFFTTVGDGSTFQISGINTTGYSALELSFGIRKSTVASTGSEMAISVSSDGANYTPLSFPALPTGTGTATWHYRTASGAIPAANNVRIRFETEGGVEFRLDDILLTGVSGPSILISGTPLAPFTTAEGSPSAPQTYTVGGRNLSANIAISAPAGFEIKRGTDSDYGATVMLSHAGGTVPDTEIDVRLKGEVPGPAEGDITHASTGAPTETVAVSGTVTAAPRTYTWKQTGAASWTAPGNWEPARTSPAATDMLLFDNGATTTATGVPSQTIGRLTVTGNTSVTLQGSNSTLTVAGQAGSDLLVDEGSALNVSGSGTVTIAVAPGAQGIIHGSMTLSGGTHRLIGGAEDAVSFESGSVFTAGSGFSGNAFGTGTAGSVQFRNGSTYVLRDGSNPFGTSGGSPGVAQFHPFSTYRHEASTAPSLSGRTYGHFEINDGGFNQTNMTGGSPLTVTNLTITSANTANINLVGGVTIRGDLSVLDGSLSFNPAAVTTINLEGTSAQTIGGDGGELTLGPNAVLRINNQSGVTLSRALTVPRDLVLDEGTLATNGNLTLGSTPSRTATISNEGGSISGGVVYERLYGLQQNGWRMMGSPLAGQPFSTLRESGFHTQGEGAAWAEMPYGEQNLLHFDAASQQFAPVGTSDDDFERARGYIFYMRASDIDGNTLLPRRWQLSGAEHAAGDIPLHRGNNDQSSYNLMANPFAGNLDWHRLAAASTNLGTSYATWDPSVTAEGGASGFKYYSQDGVGAAGRYIAPFQGFFVIATGSPSRLSFNYGQKVNAAVPSYFGKQEEDGAAPHVRLELEGGDIREGETYLVFNPDAHVGMDGSDVLRLRSLASEHASVSFIGPDDRLLAFEGRSMASGTETYRLRMEASRNGTYSVSWPDWHDIPDTWMWTLVDLASGAEIDMRMADSYDFEFTGAVEGEGAAPGDSAPAGLLADASAGARFEIRVAAAPVGTEGAEGLPGTFALHAAYPNPFNPATRIAFEVPARSDVRVAVYDVMGRELSVLASGAHAAGRHEVRWNAAGLASGTYFVRLEAAGAVQTRTVTLLR